jgi:Ca-activated chloride channel family protein
MTLSSPLLLVLGVLVVAALMAGVVVATRRRRAALAAAGISAAAGRVRPFGVWFSLAGLAVLAVAVAGPLAALPVGRSSGTVIVAMDVSNSMAATDVSPSRLAVAQQAAVSFIQAQPDTVDVGVVGFDQGAIATSLPNADHSAAVNAVHGLKVDGGTSLAAAILASLTAITGKAVTVEQDGTLPDIGYWPSATIVLFSDGEDKSRQGAAEQAATIAQNAGVHIQTVGVGTAAGTTVEVDGYQMHTAMDEQQLTTLAQTAGGSYHPVSNAAELNDVAADIDLRLTVATEQVPLAGAFIGLALLLLGAGAVVTVVRTGRLV